MTATAELPAMTTGTLSTWPGPGQTLPRAHASTGERAQPAGPGQGAERSATGLAEIRQLRQLSADELSDLYCAGDVDLPTLLAIDRADVAADRARARADAERSAWYEAAQAQYLAADAECRGNLLSELGRLEGIGQEMTLWTGSDEWAGRRASWELREFWHANGGRLSFARWRREQAMAARAWRDERDLAAMAAPVPAEPAPVPRRTVAPMTEGSIARMMRALTAYSTHADHLTARLARAQHGGIR